jgi:hypothetical protein
MLSSLRLQTSIRLPVVNRQNLILMVLLIVAGVTHAVNLFGYPFYDNVEGINIANARSILDEGSLSPYTYTYDNPPMGWILLALWLAFGSVAGTPETLLPLGRIFMLVVHVFTVMMMYGVARKFHLGQPFVILAVLVFSLSPLVTILQRRILLENFMTLWVLVSLYFILGTGRTLLHYAVSAFAIGMAFLTHVAALVFIPAIFYIVLRESHSAHRRFVLTLWFGIVISLFLGFPLQALLKDELFPPGIFIGGSHPHVSLYETQSVQLERITIDTFLKPESSFVFNLNRWTNMNEAASDRGLVFVGLISAAYVLLVAIFWRRELRPFALLLALYGLHLATLRQLYDPSIIPLLPLLAISIGITVQTMVELIKQHIPHKTISYPIFATVAILFTSLSAWTFMQKQVVYRLDQTSGQFDAIRWVNQHVAQDSLIVTDGFTFADLRQLHPNVHYYWAVDQDFQVRDEVMDGNWCNIDFLVTSPQMLADIDENQLQLNITAYRGSVTIQMYENNGWPIDIREVEEHNCKIPFP